MKNISYIFLLLFVCFLKNLGICQEIKNIDVIYDEIGFKLEKKLSKYCQIEKNKQTYSFTVAIQDSVKYYFSNKNRYGRLQQECFIFKIYIFVELILKGRRVKEVFFCNKITQRIPNYYTKNLNIWIANDLDFQCSNYFDQYTANIVRCNNHYFDLLKKINRKIKKVFTEKIRKYPILKLPVYD